MKGKKITALIQVNENQNRVPLSFDSTMNWNEYYSSLKLAIQESGLDSLKKSEKYVLSYDQTVDGSRYSVILTESSYSDFITLRMLEACLAVEFV